MKGLLLDTSAYSAFKRGSEEILEAVRTADRVHLNSIVIGELLAGFDRGKFREANRRELKEFLNFPSASALPITEETAERYSFIYRDLRERGEPIPTNDLWIAASVMESGTVLVTADKHFLKVHQIQTIFLAKDTR